MKAPMIHYVVVPESVTQGQPIFRWVRDSGPTYLYFVEPLPMPAKVWSPVMSPVSPKLEQIALRRLQYGWIEGAHFRTTQYVSFYVQECEIQGLLGQLALLDLALRLMDFVWWKT